MAIVLCDGSSASLKAVDTSLVPQLVLRKHKDEQLILLNAWEDVAAAQTPSLTQQAASLHAVVSSTLEQIEKNKHAKDVLNYKLEVLRLSQVLNAANAAGNAPSSGVATASAGRIPTPSSAPGGSKPGTSAKPPAAAVAAGDTPPAAAAAGDPRDNTTAYTFMSSYVSARAHHHKCHHVVLGVGNQSNGKTHQVGRLAKELYTTSYTSDAVNVDAPEDVPLHAAPWTLWYVKPTGSTIRPGAGVKFLVLVDAQAPSVSESLQALKFTLSELVLEGRGDRVGALIVTNSNTSGSTFSRDAATARADAVVTEAKALLLAAGQAADGGDASPQEAADPDANIQAAPQAAALPLVTTLALEGNNANPNPNLNEVPQQLVKGLAKVKSDFLVVPCRAQKSLEESTFLLLLGLLRPHVILPTSLISSR